MTNQKSRKLSKSASTKQTSEHQNRTVANEMPIDNDGNAEEENSTVLCLHTSEEFSSDIQSDQSLTPTPSDEIDGKCKEDEDANSCSSFNLEQCLNEFRSRRIRRISTQSRDIAHQDERKDLNNMECGHQDDDLIKQNRSNKEQERKGKPCKNGFCYCFTSDSGDGAGSSSNYNNHIAAVGSINSRGPNLRASRHKFRKSELPLPQITSNGTSKEKGRKSAPANLHSILTEDHTSSLSAGRNDKQLTAISRLETSANDAPLIHIIQELHSNCVISEVRVNRDKLIAQQRNRDTIINLNEENSLLSSPNKVQSILKNNVLDSKHSSQSKPTTGTSKSSYQKPIPSAPQLENISERSTPLDEKQFGCTTLNTSSKNEGGFRRSHKNAGRLLQKRLSSTHMQYKPKALGHAPPKPPRISTTKYDEKSLSSTSSSVREAERILDEFLLKHGIRVSPKGEIVKIDQVEKNVSREKTKHDKRNSSTIKQHSTRKLKSIHTLPTCPSLSDIQSFVDPNQLCNYGKNISQTQDKVIKDISFGWKEPQIQDMLNYDSKDHGKKFKSQEAQAGPQAYGWHINSAITKDSSKPETAQIGVQTIGFQIPPKIDIDTVDGNLATNIGKKNTPVKDRLFSGNSSQVFIWGEQLRNFSPWQSKKYASPKQRRNTNKFSSSRSFLNISKKRILRFVSPKKYNKTQLRQNKEETILKSVGSQTNPENWQTYDSSSTPQSPPGSYHSAVQTSHHSNLAPKFDFSRTVQSPPPIRKSSRSTQRKLHFPIHCSSGNCIDTNLNDDIISESHSIQNSRDCIDGPTKTYHSFHSDLDQDVTISKMGYILNNIRAKLEASDKIAEQTFQDIVRREQNEINFNARNNENIPQKTRAEVHRRVKRHVDTDFREPIYSEIEEDSIRISSSPQFENATGVVPTPQMSTNIMPEISQRQPQVIYAKVNKANKTLKPIPATPLAKILQDSLRNKNNTRSRDGSDVRSATHPKSVTQCQSLNNIRVLEHNSPPKNKNLSKSDLSLQRSEIFLENLCCSEIIVDENGENHLSLNKVDNNEQLDRTYVSLPDDPKQLLSSTLVSSSHDDSVSYEIPNGDVNSNIGNSHLEVNDISLLDLIDHSTPHEQSAESRSKFMTKPFTAEHSSTHELSVDTITSKNISISCPTTPHKLPSDEINDKQMHAFSLNEMRSLSRNDNCNLKNNSNNNRSAIINHSLSRYKQLKNVLQRSFKKSKDFVKSESKRLSTSLTFSASETDRNYSFGTNKESHSSIINLESLFALNDDAPINVQIARAVTICRHLPDLEISSQMVEAERLLLFSSLKRKFKRSNVSEMKKTPSTRHFFIDAIHFPIKSDASQDLFYNYFYVCTFESNGIFHSTQSVECCNNETIFRDCGIEFVSSNDINLSEIKIQCQVYMLRLRKISTLSLEPVKSVQKVLSTSLNSSSSCEEIASRFGLQGSFTITPNDFIPFEYIDHESVNAGKICLRASRCLSVPIIPSRKSTNLYKQTTIIARADLRLPKFMHNGFLNVQDPNNVHNWNRRWCSLDGVRMNIWNDMNEVKDQCLFSLDLRHNAQFQKPIGVAPRELCARARTFCLQCAIYKDDEYVDMATIFLSADNISDLDSWLKIINNVLEFITIWMK